MIVNHTLQIHFFVATVLINISIIKGCYGHDLASSVVVIDSNKRKSSNLQCYSCSSFDNPSCLNVTSSSIKQSRECEADEKCSVVRIEYQTTDIDNTIFWVLERNCSKICIPGCILLGERTRLHYCSSCCTSDFCNTNSHSEVIFSAPLVMIFNLIVNLSLLDLR